MNGWVNEKLSRRLLEVLVEELVGLAGSLIPLEGKSKAKAEGESILEGFEVYGVDSILGRLELVRDVLAEVEGQLACPKCKAHLVRARQELDQLAGKVPTYERIAKINRELRELYKHLGREKEL